jgi:hypothetical protein
MHHRVDVPLLIILALVGACLALTLRGLGRGLDRYQATMAAQTAQTH